MKSFRLTRRLEVAFIILLALCTAQLAYWMIDEVRYTASVRDRLNAAHAADVDAARLLLRRGVPWADVSRVYPSLSIAADSFTVTISPGTIAALHAQRFHRLNRYAWEGAFFLAVLIGAMVMVHRVLRAETELHHRQEQFLTGVSHELKSPLASLRLSAETMALRNPPPSRRAELVHRLLADLARLERMISNVLDASRLSAGETRAFPARLSLADEIGSVVEEMREQAVECETSVATDVSPDLIIRADPDGVRTVLRNLLHNAIKATCGGGNVTVRASAANGHVRVEVHDDGLGFPPDEASRLFDKFYRLEGDARARMGGTGLGLYLVRRCAELDGASVTAQSAGAGRGAVFTVAWPAGIAEDS
jgi:signal transduction histidine kinase